MLPFMTGMVRVSALGAAFAAALALAGLQAAQQNGAPPHVPALAPPAKDAAYRPDCGQPDACLDEKYKRAVELVTHNLASASQAANSFCAQTTWPERSTEYVSQLLSKCNAATAQRITADLR